MEKSVKWYDMAYKMNSEYKKEPEDSRYYPIWNKALSLINDERIIDFGCGSGQFAKLLLKNGKTFLFGFDFSKEAIAIARKLNTGHELQFFTGDLIWDLLMPQPDLYDLVVCFEVLEHIERDLDLIKKIDSGKRFIFSVPNYDYHSHVRKFKKLMDIQERYGGLLDFIYFYPFTMHDDHIIYLVNSVKK